MMKTNKTMTVIALILFAIVAAFASLMYSKTVNSSWGREMEGLIIKDDSSDGSISKP
jgi:hypothetical protein